MENEAALITAAQQDKRAFVDLYDLHFDSIYRFFLSRVSDSALAEDLTSETFMKALEKIGSYKYTGKPFSAWLYRIAINEMYQHFRKNKIEQKMLNAQWNETELSIHGADFDFKEEQDEKEMKEKLKHVHNVLLTMKQDDQDILSLRYFNDLSYKDIADTLDINVSNVGVRINRALERLSKLCPFASLT